jgi:hypothetical protein
MVEIMGLLDGLNDPLSMGLLGAGAALLQPRRVGFGDAINAFQGSAVETQNRVALQKRNEQQTQLLMMQLAQMKEAQEREKQRRTMAQQFNQTGAQQAASLPGGPTPQNAAQIPNMPGGFDAYGYMQALLGAGDLEGAGQASRFTPKAPEDFTLSEGQTRHGADGRVKASGAPKQGEFERMLGSIYPPGSPEYNRALQNWVTKQTTHQPQVSVSYGAPVAGRDAEGRDVFFQPSKDGKSPPSIIPGVAPPKAQVPAALQEKIAQNTVTLQKIDKAIAMVDANPAAFGVKNYLPDAVTQRWDPDGVEPRAMVSDIGGQKIHDRSGAAVTVGESERLKPYIPSDKDTPETVGKKLRLFRAEYTDMIRAINSGASVRDAARPGPSAPSAPSGRAPSLEDALKQYLPK